jgi:hypothetical protein
MIELWHIGEKLLAEMINKSEKLRVYLCEQLKIARSEANHYKASHEMKLGTCADFKFDGMHKVDVGFFNDNKCFAIEAKLGLDRLTACEFKKRFLNPYERSGHTNPKIKGSMIAILERNYCGKLNVKCSDKIIMDMNSMELEQEWILVVRRKVRDSWKSNGQPSLSDKCNILAFEDIVSQYGTQEDFDELVQKFVVFNYYSKWGLEEGMPSGDSC